MVGSVLNTAKRLRTVEQDVQHLLAYFTQAVQQGAQPTFTTFKNLWTKHHYSWIYLVRNNAYFQSRTPLASVMSAN